MVKVYDRVEDYYADTDVNFGEGVEIKFGSTDPAQALGQNVNVSLAPQATSDGSNRTEFLTKLQNTKHDSSKDYNVYTGTAYEGSMITYGDMLKQMGYKDKTNSPLSLKNMIASPINFVGAMLDPKYLKGPTGKDVLNLGFVSEAEMKAHYDNFSDVADAYAQIGSYDGTLGSYIESKKGVPFNFNTKSLRNTDVGFAATIGNFHFSRPPNRGYYNGLKSHIDGGSGNGHQMLKTMEALNKGFDPTGYRLDGKNEDNGGLAHSSKSMGAGITEDGYYVSMANNGYGYTKSVLYGRGGESQRIADEMGIDPVTLANAMKLARNTKDMTVSQALAKVGVTKINDISNFRTASIPSHSNLNINQDYFVNQAQNFTDLDTFRDEEIAKNRAAVQKEIEEDEFAGFGADMKLGGQVGQLANILRQNRLGMNLGGQAQPPQVNVNELGFVDGKTPDQVTDQQSIADDKPVDMRREDYLLNSPSVEKHGIRNVVNMVMRALKDASASGVEIVDMPADIPRDDLVKVLASASEFRIPRDLVPYIGLANLETINEKGKSEVTRRARQT